MDRQQGRAKVGRAVMVSGVLLLVLAALFWWEVVPLDPEVKTLATAVVLVAAVTDFLVGLYFFRG